MKRIISACLEQTIHFQLKDGVEKSIANTHEWKESVATKKAFFSKYKNSAGPIS